MPPLRVLPGARLPLIIRSVINPFEGEPRLRWGAHRTRAARGMHRRRRGCCPGRRCRDRILTDGGCLGAIDGLLNAIELGIDRVYGTNHPGG